MGVSRSLEGLRAFLLRARYAKSRDFVWEDELIFREVNHWTNVDQLRGALFFAQIVEEMTFPYSLDSNKAPTTCASFLIDEVIQQIQVCLREDMSLASVGHILDELELRLQKNIVVSELISMSLSRYMNYDKAIASEILRRLHVLARELEPHLYVVKCMDLLRELIKNKKKKNIEFVSREMVTALVNLGMNPEYINGVTIDCFFNKSKPVNSLSVLDEFFKSIYPNSHQFNVCFQMMGLSEVLDEDKIGIFDMSISDELPVEFAPSLFSHNFGDNKKKIKYITISDISAMDVNTAIQKAENRISKLHDLFTVFHHKNQFELSEYVLVVQCCIGGVRKVKKSRNRMHFVSDFRPKKASKKLDELIKYVGLPSGPDRERFFRVVDFHSKSVNSEAIEGQIINLWISLETITPPNSKISKIDGVVNGAMPFLSLNYYRRIFDQVTFDLVRWNRAELKKTLNSMNFDRPLNIVDKVARLIVLDEHDSIRRCLYEKIGDFELLRFRVFRLNEVLSKPKSALSRLEEHRERVQWQLRRIYRTRNSIVHSGELPEYARMLVENAHDYFDQIFDTSCKLSMGPSGFLDFEECFDYAKWKYEQYISDIKMISEFSEKTIGSIIWRSTKNVNESYRYIGGRWS